MTGKRKLGALFSPMSNLNQIATDYIFGSEHADLIIYRKDFGTKFKLDGWASGMQKNAHLVAFTAYESWKWVAGLGGTPLACQC